jgi:hypothetical protein
MNLVPLLLLWLVVKGGKGGPSWPTPKHPPPSKPRVAPHAVPKAAPKAAAKGPFAKAIPKVPKIPHIP